MTRTSDRWPEIDRLFHAALERSPKARPGFLDVECAGDDELRREVESLLDHAPATEAFLERPALHEAAQELAGDVSMPPGKPMAAPLGPGTSLGKYRIERQLGQGGMGLVFLAHDSTLQRSLAIKVLESPEDDDASYARLLREARSASALNHPNICTVYEVGEVSGVAFIAMEYIDGRSLRDVIDAGPLPVEDAVRHAIEAADALAHAHNRGVVHRDLKAANAIVSANGRLKIVDFGLAQRSDARVSDGTTQLSSAVGVAVGTPYAMAPEQVRGQVADARTDIWALGVMLHEMLFATRPFTGATAAELFSAILRDPPAPSTPGSSGPLREILHKCLAKNPAERYQRAADVRLVLEAVASRLRRRDALADPLVAPGAVLPPSPLLNLTGGSTGFVGRERELAQMEQVWSRAAAGQRQLILIAGDPGIGKTYLASRFASLRSESAASILAGRCDEEALVPYQPFVEALSWYARVCPELDLREQLEAIGGGAELGILIPELLRRIPDLPTQPAMNPEGQRYRLFEAVAGLLAQASALRPMMIVFDDVHWADKPTLLMLRHVVRASSTAALCIVGTYRESELARTHPLAEMLTELRREPAVTRLSLRGLEQAQVKGLIDTFAGRDSSSQLTRLVADITEGNPFFIGEMLRHLTETGALATLRSAPSGKEPAAFGLPEGVKEVIGRRLSRLSESCNRALSLAAVLGREFDIEILEALDVEKDTLLDAIDEAMQAKLISEAPSRTGCFTFAHALIRETLYEELTTTRRVRLHLRVGETIERLAEGRSDPPLADLAYHFVRAASASAADKAIDYATRAGDRAADALAHEEAARLYGMALESLDLKVASPETERRRVDLHTRLARAYGAVAQWALQKMQIERALRHLDPQQVDQRCELLLELGAAWFFLLDIKVVEPLMIEALELAEQVQRSDLAADAIAWLAVCRQAAGDLRGAIEMQRKAIARASRPQTAMVALAFAPLTFYLAGQPGEGIALGAQAAERARASRDAGVVMYAFPHLGLSLGSAGRYVEATKIFDEARQFGRKYGVLPPLARATAMQAGLHLSVFDFDGAEALQREARELAHSLEFAPTLVSASIDLLLTFARRNDPGSAEQLLAETTIAAATTPGWHDWLWRLRLCQVRAELALARGDFDAAVTEASDGINQSHARMRPKYETLGLITRARALNSLGRTRQAIEDARRSVAVARAVSDPALLLVALDALLLLDGDDTSAADARALDEQISSALPNDVMRQRFAESDVVRRLRRV